MAHPHNWIPKSSTNTPLPPQIIQQALPDTSKLISLENNLQWLLAAKRFVWQASQGSEVRAGKQVPLYEKVGGWGCLAVGCLEFFELLLLLLLLLLLPLLHSTPPLSSCRLTPNKTTPLPPNPHPELSQVDVWLGDATHPSKFEEITRKLNHPIDFLFIDGIPKQSLDYLTAALPHLAPGALVVADNAGVFGEGGMKAYLQAVRGGGEWTSTASLKSHLEWREDVADALEVSVYKGTGGGEEAAGIVAAVERAAAAAGCGGVSSGAAAAAAGQSSS